MREILTFDDQYTLESFGMRNVKGNSQPMMGDISERTEKVFGRKGLLDFGNEVGGFVEKFPVLVIAENPIERAYLIRNFKQFMLDKNGYPRFVKVHKNTEPDVYYWGKLKTAPTPELYTNAATFDLEITNLDGVKYAVAEANDILWGSEVIDFQSGLPLGHTGSGANALQITVNTTVTPTIVGMAVFPYLVLNGTGTNVVIESNGKKIQVGTFNGKLEIDCANYIAYLDGAEKFIRMDRFQLVKGKTLKLSGSALNFTFTNNYRDEL